MRSKKPLPLGTINGRVKSWAAFNNNPFVFDGTMLGLIKAATANGVRIDDSFTADFGGGSRKYRMIPAAHDARADGRWAEEVR
jgi:hypothetical protein